MDTVWMLGVLCAGVENVQHLAGGTAPTRAGAVEAASGALVDAARERGRQEYRISVADTRIIVRPGLTEHGAVDLVDLATALPDLERFRSEVSWSAAVAGRGVHSANDVRKPLGHVGGHGVVAVADGGHEAGQGGGDLAAAGVEPVIGGRELLQDPCSFGDRHGLHLRTVRELHRGGRRG